VEAELRAWWAADAGTSSAADAALDGLLARHREAHRRYHTLVHVHRVVTDAAQLAGEAGAPDPSAVRLAAFFHDAVYVPQRGDNEARSADLAVRVLTHLGQPPARIAEVARLIRLTARHEAVDPAIDPAGAALLDADLAILGSDPAVYSAYARAIRVEYAHVADDEWRAGRTAVLERLLGRPALYALPSAREREAHARANIGAELAALHRDVP
jgi:predicted metal-dependent HD superfamily phosphohydrolase